MKPLRSGAMRQPAPIRVWRLAAALARRVAPARVLRLAPACALLLVLAACSKDECPVCPPVIGPQLRIGFMTNRPPSSQGGSDIYFYDVGSGKPATMAPNASTYFDEGPFCLSGDGCWMVFYSTRVLTGTSATLFLYETATAAMRILALPGSGQYNSAYNPALDHDGSRLAFHYRVGGTLFSLSIALLDVKADSILPTPSLHLEGAGEWDPALTHDGDLIAFTSNRFGSLDVVLYSVPGDSVVPTPGLDSDASDTGVSLSGAGRYVAFHSDRAGGQGLFDVYVYDRQAATLLPMPGANTAFSEINPALSPDGRYVAYTSENDGAGDIRLYDLRAGKLVPLPGCNDPYFPERFPSLAERP